MNIRLKISFKSLHFYKTTISYKPYSRYDFMCLDIAKMHCLKEIVSHEAITKAVNSIWKKGIFLNNCHYNFKFLRRLNVPRNLFVVNVLADFLFFMLLSLMMMTSMCVKAEVLQKDMFRCKLSHH